MHVFACDVCLSPAPFGHGCSFARKTISFPWPTYFQNKEHPRVIWSVSGPKFAERCVVRLRRLSWRRGDPTSLGRAGPTGGESWTTGVMGIFRFFRLAIGITSDP